MFSKNVIDFLKSYKIRFLTGFFCSLAFRAERFSRILVQEIQIGYIFQANLNIIEPAPDLRNILPFSPETAFQPNN
ncbi:hypothetical protein MSLAZ_0905 [Methanosarcina lacustris Z-7289]|uniref:Uncharacterized protein n=1 Tax=Methanosarcina lacustris Z-7289 TaxID=1434111 RepID=A0A0E3S231_9EURY|nr:hypothetical protein MSLAZ_0905 [Methanosarcina lacustris Z-7289]